LGTSKQLLLYKEKGLLHHAVDAANEVDVKTVIVVLGANADVLLKEVENKHVYVAMNYEWKEGMASSIRCGMQALLDISPAADAVIIMVCDQPFVSASLLYELITVQKERGKKIVASKYANTMGPPVLFHKSIFPELLELKGDAGARDIIVEYADDVITILFPKGDIDIDTATEYEALKQNKFS